MPKHDIRTCSCASCDQQYNRVYPNPRHPCWDCGSTIIGHHTAHCGTAPDAATRDLCALPGTQYWDGTHPEPQTQG